MITETERKFLVHPQHLPKMTTSFQITQFYLASSPEMRVRWCDDDTYITLTIKSAETLTRSEFEFFAEHSGYFWRMRDLRLPGSRVLQKERFQYYETRPDLHDAFSERLWFIDQFHNDYEGLWLAEYELQDGDDPTIVFPTELFPWLGTEVTRDRAYYNLELATGTDAERRRVLASAGVAVP